MNLPEQAGELIKNSELLGKNLTKLVERLSPYMKTQLPKPELQVNVKTSEESQIMKKLRLTNESLAYVTLTLDILLNSVDL